MINFDLIKNHINPKTILDIGANIGQFHMLCREKFPDAYILSMEGNAACEFHLAKNTGNYIICLLGAENKKTIFYKNDNALGTGHSIYKEISQFYREENTIEEVTDMHTLDSVLEAYKLNIHFDLIKLDTQGSEVDILKGATNTLKNTKAILAEVACTRYNENAPMENDVREYMKSIGFAFAEEIYFEPQVSQKDLLFLRL